MKRTIRCLLDPDSSEFRLLQGERHISWAAPGPIQAPDQAEPDRAEHQRPAKAHFADLADENGKTGTGRCPPLDTPNCVAPPVRAASRDTQL